MNRIDVEWGPGALDRAAQILVQRMGPEAGRYWFVLPARRGVRKFREALARHLPAEQEPPQGISQGAWLDVFRPARRPAVDRQEAVHVWAACLRELTSGEFRRAFGRERPAPDAAMAWFASGQRARDLHAEIVQAGFDFDRLVEELPEGARRWKLWAQVHTRYRERLAELGWCDGLEERAEAPLLPDAQVVFVFVPTASAVERATLAALGERATALVLCGPDHAQRFDDQGLLVPSAWPQDDLPMSRAEWHVVADPKAQAEAVEHCLARWSAERPTAPHEVVLGAPDPEVRPFLARRMARWPAELHAAGGEPLGQTWVAEGLRALAAVLPDWRYGDTARWLRHPDVQGFLVGEGSDLVPPPNPEPNPAGHPEQPASPAGEGAPPDPGPRGFALPRLDDYQRWHYPLHLRRLRSKGAGSRIGRAVQTQWSPLREHVDRLFGGVARSLPAWADALREWLLLLYGGRDFDACDPKQAAEAQALEACAATLERWKASRASWWPEVSASAACLWLLAEWQGQAASSPPQATPSDAAEGMVSLEWLGWHELLWDDAPDLIVTGFQEGAIPEPLNVDNLIHPSERRRLSLPEGEERAARDQYFLHALLRCRRRVALMTGSKSAEGDPLRPSRLAFFRPDEEIIEALQHAFPQETRGALPPEEADGGTGRKLPCLDHNPPLERLSVTDFKTYLDSPYLFYLQRFLRLETVDDLGRELDGRGFGTLVHAVLERFGLGEHRHSQEKDVIYAAVLAELDQETTARFGDNVLPAVELQIEALRRRLEWFAEKQAAWRQAGWRIEHVEWSADEPVYHLPGDPPIPLVGKIDRIDVHPTEGYAILDYKTGDDGKTPRATHGKGDAGTWKDLQLPLYRHLARPVTEGKPVRVGYFNLGKDPSRVGVQLAEWTDPQLETADEQAATIVRSIQGALVTGDFPHVQSARVQDAVFQALTGLSLVGAVDDGSAEEGEEFE